MSDTGTIPMDRLVKAYVGIRNAIQECTKRYDEEIADLETKKKAVAQAMREQMEAAGIKSAKTAAGVAYLTTKTRYYAQDWGSFKEFVLEHGAIDLLEKRVAQKNFEQWVEEHPGAFPPGIGADSVMDVVVRKN